MKEYYNENDYLDEEAEVYGEEIDTEELGDDYEQYIPYYDADDGEYKYIPAAGDWEEAPLAAPEGQVADDKSEQILEKIQQLKSELDSVSKKSDDDKITRLNGEIKSLRDQLFQIKTANELKKQFEEFKKEFLQSQQSRPQPQPQQQQLPPQPQDRYGYSEKSYARRPQKAYYRPPQKKESAEIDIERLVEKVKSEIYQEKDFDTQRILKEIEKLNSGNLTELQIIEKINMAVEERINAGLDDLVAKIGEKFETKLNELKSQTAKLFNETAQRAYEIDESSAEKIEKLSEKLQNYKNETKALLDEYNEKQNDVIVRFSELAEKIQATNVIDKDNLYNETMLDGISDIKSEFKNLLKKSDYQTEINALKENIDSISAELASLKESMIAAFNEATDYQFKLINSNIENIGESSGAITQAAEDTLKEIGDIKEQTLSRIETLENGVAEYRSAIEGKLAENFAAIESKIAENFGAIESKLAENFGGIENILTENFGATENKLTESIGAAEEKISGSVMSAENRISESIASAENKISENIGGLSDAFAALKDEIINAVREAAEQYTSGIMTEIQNLAAAKDEIISQIADMSQSFADGMRSLKSDINQGIAAQNSQIAELKRQIEDLKGVVDMLAEVPNSVIKEIVENIEGKIQGIVTASDNMASAVEGMGISVDNLLRQQEDNISAQNELSGEIAKLNAQISSLLSSSRNIADMIDKSRDIEELAKNIEKTLSKTGGADKQALAALGGELRELKMMVANLGNTDLSYDLSSIYAELRKLNQGGETDVENLKLYNEIESLRNQLNKIKQQEENVENKQKPTKAKPQ